MPQPSADDQVRFLTNLQRLLSEGVFTATYKYALLLTLADLAVEVGDDSGAALTLSTKQIAEKFIGLYWRSVVPYVPRGASDGVVLQQNSDRQAAVIRLVRDARERCPSIQDLRRNTTEWRELVRDVDQVVRLMPLWKLQRVGNQVLDFIYEQRASGSDVQLHPGVAYCLRQFHPLITELVRGAWLQYIRKINSPTLGTTADLAEFLFGSERADLSAVRPILLDLQNGRCFYCERALTAAGDVDHFIPWARYPVDLGHNFVLAHTRCNGAKGMMLAAEQHLAHWAERNRDHGAAIGAECDRVKVVHDLAASRQVALWAYRQAATAGGLGWVRGKEYRAIAEGWRQAVLT